MNIIDANAQLWFLYFYEGHYYLDGYYSHSFAVYSHMIQLSEEEIKNYQEKGAEYITKLVQKIQYSAPGVQGNTSPYKSRKVSDEIYKLANALHQTP